MEISLRTHYLRIRHLRHITQSKIKRFRNSIKITLISYNIRHSIKSSRRIKPISSSQINLKTFNLILTISRRIIRKLFRISCRHTSSNSTVCKYILRSNHLTKSSTSIRTHILNKNNTHMKAIRRNLFKESKPLIILLLSPRLKNPHSFTSSKRIILIILNRSLLNNLLRRITNLSLSLS